MTPCLDDHDFHLKFQSLAIATLLFLPYFIRFFYSNLDGWFQKYQSCHCHHYSPQQQSRLLVLFPNFSFDSFFLTASYSLWNQLLSTISQLCYWVWLMLSPSCSLPIWSWYLSNQETLGLKHPILPPKESLSVSIAYVNGYVLVDYSFLHEYHHQCWSSPNLDSFLRHQLLQILSWVEFSLSKDS